MGGDSYQRLGARQIQDTNKGLCGSERRPKNHWKRWRQLHLSNIYDQVLMRTPSTEKSWRTDQKLDLKPEEVLVVTTGNCHWGMFYQLDLLLWTSIILVYSSALIDWICILFSLWIWFKVMI